MINTPDQFNLHEAVEAYISQLDRDNQLRRDEHEEIADHLLTEVEILQQGGFGQQEAFSLAVTQFGPTELISREYQRIKPFYTIRKAAIAAALFLFLFVFIVGSLYALSSVVWVVSREFALSGSAEKYLDITVKVIFTSVAIIYLWRRFDRRKTLKVREMIVIPMLGLAAPFFNNILNHFLSGSGHISYSSLLTGHMNTYMIFSILLAGLLIVSYRLIFKWHYASKKPLSETTNYSKVKIGILTAFFLLLAIFVVVTSLISCFTFWLSTVGYYGIGWVKWLDLVLKFLFLGGMLAIIASRINNRKFFKKLELLLIPLIGFASPYLSDRLFISVFPPDHWNHSTRKTLELFNGNSQVVIVFTILIITVTTYLLIYKEQKQIQVSG